MASRPCSLGEEHAVSESQGPHDDAGAGEAIWNNSGRVRGQSLRRRARAHGLSTSEPLAVPAGPPWRGTTPRRATPPSPAPTTLQLSARSAPRRAADSDAASCEVTESFRAGSVMRLLQQ